MSKIITDSITDTLSFSEAGVSISGTPGDIVDLTTTLDSDGVANPIDGVLIPLFNRDTTIDKAPTTDIVAATDLGLCNLNYSTTPITVYKIETTDPHNLKLKEKVSIGTTATPTRLGSFNVVHIYSDTEFGIDADPTIAAASFVGENIYETHQFSGSAELGFLSVDLGSAAGTAGANVRLALVYTLNPASGETYAQRLANEEVVWSRVWPSGSLVQTDFHGLEVYNNGEIPPPLGYAPATGYEKRLMLVAYFDSGAPVTIQYGVELTYRQSTTYEVNC